MEETCKIQQIFNTENTEFEQINPSDMLWMLWGEKM